MATTVQSPEAPANGTKWWIAPAFVLGQDELPRTLVAHREALIQAAIGGVAKCSFNCLPNFGWSKVVLVVAGGTVRTEAPNRALSNEPPTEEEVRRLRLSLERGDPDHEELRVRLPRPPYVNGGRAKYGNGVRRAVARR